MTRRFSDGMDGREAAGASARIRNGFDGDLLLPVSVDILDDPAAALQNIGIVSGGAGFTGRTEVLCQKSQQRRGVGQNKDVAVRRCLEIILEDMRIVRPQMIVFLPASGLGTADIAVHPQKELVFINEI